MTATEPLSPLVSPWNDRDRLVLANVERCLEGGLTLKRWWERTDASNGYNERFDLTRAFHQSYTSFGFFDQAEVYGRPMPVMGVVDDMLYDQPKHASKRTLPAELREFVLHYFLRISSFQEPQATFEAHPKRLGFGYSQVYYKLRQSGFIGKFPESQEFAISDLRELGAKYQWIVAKVQLFDFNLALSPWGSQAPEVVVPLNEQSYLVLTADFITNRETSQAGVRAEYGFGYAFLTENGDPGVLAYGPGHFDAAFKLIEFRMLDSGEIRVHMAFAANRPRRLLNLSLNPVDWGIRMADLMSFGLTSQILGPIKNAVDAVPGDGLSFDPLWAVQNRQWLEKRFLLQHFQQHYRMATGSLLTWRQIPDWLDHAALPDWVRNGVRS
jgi:hypothetical protein